MQSSLVIREAKVSAMVLTKMVEMRKIKNTKFLQGCGIIGTSCIDSSSIHCHNHFRKPTGSSKDKHIWIL